jgi:sulfocyanin
MVTALVLTGFLSVNGVQRAAMRTASAASGDNVDWPLFGNTSDNTRYSELSQIDTGNVSQLGVAWTQAEGEGQITLETDPVVVNGVMYYTTNKDEVRAVDGATGKLLWQYTPRVNFYQAVAGGGAGVPTNRGVAVGNDRVYLLTFDNQLIALQQATGEKLWSTVVANASDGYSESSPPTYWNGLLILGSAESDSGRRGFVAAYDANTGKQVWKFYTVPAEGQGWVPKGSGVAGGDVWMPPVVDTRTGIVYFGTGNPYPDFSNKQRPGCDPWVDAVVALDATTGKFVWAHTELCNDIWDLDSESMPIIFDAVINHRVIHAVGHSNKDGIFFTYDAATGKVLAQSPYANMFYRRSWQPKSAGPALCPGNPMAYEYSPYAYSPLTGAAYDPGMEFCFVSVPVPIPAVRGFMAAIDVSTGKFLWRTKVPGAMVGGAVATAGNLVFSGGADAHLYGFNATTGKIAWNANLGVQIGAAPITYEINGTQYLAVAAGGASIGAFFGKPDTLGGTIIAFKLHGSPIKKLPAAAGAATSGLQLQISTKGMQQVNPWEYIDNVHKTVVFKVVAAATTDNNGFNFNGYSKGKANFIVPTGWIVDFIFTNNQVLRHSMGVTNSLQLGKATTVTSTTNSTIGVSTGQIQYASFTTDPKALFATAPGKYYLVCLIAGHAAAGMWDNFTVSATATAPTIQNQ